MSVRWVLSIALCAIAAAGEDWRPTPRAESSTLQIMEVRAVRLEKPHWFIRKGRYIERRDGLLIRVRVPYPGAFFPRVRQGPTFVYGFALCSELVNPILTGEAVLLCPQPEKGEPVVLWLTVEGGPRRGAEQAEYREASRPGSKRAVPVEPPAAGAPEVTFHDAKSLREHELAKARAKAPLKR